MANPAVALSYTRISAFKKCPLRFRDEYVTKAIPYKETPAAKAGKVAHTQLEMALRTLKPEVFDTPQGQKEHDGWVEQMSDETKVCYEYILDQVVDDGWKFEPEKKYAAKYVRGAGIVPCTYFDRATLHRGAADVVALKRVDGVPTGRVFDLKNGNPNYFDVEQLRDMAVQTMMHYPQVAVVEAEFVSHRYYAASNPLPILKRTFDRSEIAPVQTEWARTLSEVTAMKKSGEWPHKQHQFCGSCQVKSCPINPNRKEDMTI